MKRTFKLLLAGVFALLAFAACDDDETESVIDNGQEEEYDDAYYAAQASVTSSDANFTATEDGGEIWFKTEGGSVTLSVSCGTQWTVGNTAADLFETSATSSSLTITAGQNTVERELEGTITLRTANQRITFATITVTQAAYGAPEISVEATEWGFPAKGELTAEIAVEASADWTAATGDGWLTVARDGDVLRLAAEENAQTNERSAKVTLTCTDGIGTSYEYVTVTQEAGAYITTSVSAVTFVPAGGTTSVAVESNYEWDYSYDSSNGWFSVSRDGDALSVTADENGDDKRSGTITITAGDGAENVTELQLTVSQAGSDAMILTYTIGSSNTTTRLPLYGKLDCTVDWGDGTVERITSAQPSHTYASAGTYDITISGTVPALNSQGLTSTSSSLPITAVKQWGRTGLTDMQYAFNYCRNLASLPENTDGAFADVTSFYYAFRACNSLKAIPADLFANCSKLTSVERTFSGCEVITEIPEGLFNDCTELTSFYYTFYQCSSLAAIPKDLFKNSTKATDFGYTFGFCSGLEEIPEELFNNCTEVTTFSNVFVYCTGLKSIPAGLFKNCTKVKSFESAFSSCSHIEEIPAGLFDNCPEVTSFAYVFDSCYSLKTVSAGLFDNCTKVQSFRGLFYSCSSIGDIPSGLFDNCPEVTIFSMAFYGCSLNAIPPGLFDKCPKVTSFNATFYSCYNITEIPEGLFDNCPEVTDFTLCFNRCSSVTTIPDGLFDKCPKVTTFKAVFQQCISLEEIPEGLFDKCPEVTDMSYAFNLSESIEKVPTGLFGHNLKVTDFAQALCCLYVVDGESPYTEIEVGGETVRVHLYDRANYTSELGCVAPTSYSSCFLYSSFSDMDSIPSSWGGNGAGLQTKGMSVDYVTQEKEIRNN